MKIDGSYVSKRMLYLAYSIFASFIFLDLALDFLEWEGELSWVIQVCEGLILGLGTIAFIYLLKSVDQRQEAHSKIDDLRQEVNFHQKENEKLKQDVHSFVQEYFTSWGLSESEKDIGQFLLKGLSFQEIATIRNVSDKTIRNQSLSIYSKSGLSGKHELATFFLEELFYEKSVRVSK